MKTFNNSDNKKTQFHAGDVLRYVLRGAPFVWTNDQVPWNSVRVPRFPVAFSLLSAIFWTVISKVKAMQVAREPVSLGKFLFSFVTSSIVNGVFFLILNAIIMGGFWLVLTNFKSKSAENGESTMRAGAQRVSYFSTVFQSVFFLILAGPFLAQRYLTPCAWVEYTLVVSMVGFGIMRLLAVFQSMRHETEGSIVAGLFALVFCFDLWGTFLPIACGYIW